MSIAALPTPIPVTPGTGPESWQGRPLANVRFEIRVQDKLAHDETIAFHGVDTYSTVEHGPYRGGTQVFDPVPGARNLSDAVTAASNVSANLSDGRAWSPAVAVLQAADGAYYTAPLWNKGHSWLSLESGAYSDATIKDVTSDVADVRAIVGRTSWVNFTGDAAQPELAG